MGDRKDEHALLSRCSADGDHDGAWPIFLTLLASLQMFPMPKVTVADYEARNRSWQAQWGLLEFVVEMSKFARDLGAADRINPLLR